MRAIGLETGLNNFQGQISLSLGGCTEPYLITWFDPEIPQLSRFMTAAELRDVNELKTILASGINVNARDFQQHTALMYAVVDPTNELSKHPTYSNTLKFKPDLLAVSILLRAGGDPNYRDAHGVTPLRLADPSSARLLLDAGADLNARDDQGKTPLMFAAQKSDARLTKLFLANRAAVNLRDNEGNSALIYAVKARSKDAVELLVASGADPNAQNSAGESALSVARERAKSDWYFRRIANLLERNGVSAPNENIR